MMSSFTVHTTPHFDRLLRGLGKRHHDLATLYARALEILTEDPQNRTRRFHIIKLEGILRGEGQWRLALGRWRFRYDIFDREVWLFRCGLRKEDTYR
ncbi:MAG: hypothetical protein AAB539_04495 [Patescibacteria group bacterium]